MSPLLVASAGLHATALVATAAAPHLWPWTLGAIAANHTAIAAASMSPRGRWLGPNLSRLPAAGADELALTFDDGPDPEVTPRVLAALAAANATATFFCIGQRAARHPDIVHAIVAAGHAVENHTFSHRSSFALARSQSMRDDIRRGQHALVSAGAPSPRLFRAPAGMRNPWLFGVLEDEGLVLVSWTRRGFDTRTRDARLVAARLIRQLSAGDILLMHDGNSARAPGGAPVVLDALDRLLDVMARQGLRSIALPAALGLPDDADPPG